MVCCGGGSSVGKLWNVIHVDLAPGWRRVAPLDLKIATGCSNSRTLWLRMFRVEEPCDSLNSGRIPSKNRSWLDV